MRALFFVLAFLIETSDACALPSFKEVKDSYRKSDAALLDRHGTVIHELRTDQQGRRLEWVAIRDISPAVKNAVISSEDRRFFEHSGVDWKALGSAAARNLFSDRPRGASTLTMQLATIVDPKLKPRNVKKTVEQKWDQIKAAREMEKAWTKSEILEAYLNLVPFRGELQGISAASRGLFHKEPSGLNEEESLILASLIPSPNASVEGVSRRACLLANSLKWTVACEDTGNLAKRTLAGAYSIRQNVALALHVARILLKKGEARVASTLDGDLQRFASEVLKHHLMAVNAQNVRDGAVLVVENRTGEVLAYVSAGANGHSVDGVRARRQAGSTLKPFLYATAFENRILTPASLLDDSPLDIPTPQGIYRPENYGNDFKGMVSVRTALASSLNVPAVRALALVGTDDFVRRLRSLGFDDLEAGDYYGPSLALGSADVSLYGLVNAYRTLANGGVWSGLKLVPGKERRGSKRVFSEESSFLVSSILSDREARSITFGLESPLSARYWAAVKTGTSKDMRDNWCIGYSRKYTVGVWVGNFSGEAMWNVSGVTGAAPVWIEIMNHIYQNHAGEPIVPPDQVIARKVYFQDDVEPFRSEWFRAGTEPGDLAREATAVGKKIYVSPRITYPREGTIIALDPDIPVGYQVLFFEAEVSSDEEWYWAVDGANIGGTDTIVPWEPKPGKHRLSLVDRRGNIIDAVRFEVRGDWPRDGS